MYVSVVLGLPSRVHPIRLERLMALEKTRIDVKLAEGETGTAIKRHTIVFDPSRPERSKLTLIDGRLETRNPDHVTVQWMLELAEALEGRVINQSLRTYRTPTETYIHSDDLEARRRHLRRVKAARSPFFPNKVNVAKWIIIIGAGAAALALYIIFS